MINLNRAFFPGTEPQVLLGRRLLPQLTLWHLHQLYAATSPLLGLADDRIGLGDLVVAASICVTVYPAVLTPCRSRLELLRHHLAKWRSARYGLEAELRFWRAYWKRSNAGPLLSHPKGARSCESPAALALWASLKLRGFSKADAWNEPVATAAWYKAALAEAEGADIRLMTEEKRAAYIRAGRGHLLEAYA
jgi:hypothetical protein